MPNIKQELCEQCRNPDQKGICTCGREGAPVLDVETVLAAGAKSKFFKLLNNSDDYIDFTGWLNRTSKPNGKEVHVTLSFSKEEKDAAYLLLIEEQFVGGVNKRIGPEREITLDYQAALKILQNWKGTEKNSQPKTPVAPTSGGSNCGLCLLRFGEVMPLDAKGVCPKCHVKSTKRFSRNNIIWASQDGQPVTCPTCGARTDFVDCNDGLQDHTCLDPKCGRQFAVDPNP
jgi:hypothetical protein